jgi:hypothetical protein
MGVTSGPAIVTNGLILDLDVANRKSFIDTLSTSYTNTSSWASGQTSSATGYGANETTGTENARVIATDPWNNSNVVWETRASGDGNGDGGWNTDWYNVDRTKLHRFSVWMRRTSSTAGGTFYFGLYGNGPTWGVLRLDNSSNEGNPYWECAGTGTYTQNQWYLYIGHCYPAGTTFTGRHPDSGYYLPNGTKYSWNGCNIGNDVKMLSDTTQLLHRTYHFYCGDNTTRLQFAYPRIDVCNGNEPTLQELLNYSPGMLRDNSGRENHHTLGNYFIPNSSNPRRFTLDGTNHGFVRNGALNEVSNNCTVVIYYRTTDTQELWVRGNQNNGVYLSASASNNYYHSGCGTPTNFVDLQTVVRPDTPINYRNGAYHMWEAKAVDFSGWTYFDWFLYPGGWQMTGDVSKILVYNRSLTSDESAQNFYALRSRFGI